MTASATPAASPPPESGTSTAAMSGRSSITSSPTVPCPAMTRASSKGDISTSPCSPASRRLSASALSCDRPTMRTSAPSARMPSTLVCGTSADMQTTARRPRARAAKARARPWLPVEQQTTPAVSGASAATAFAAPRSLNAPTGCMLSSFSSTSPPATRARCGEGRSGVRTAIPAMARRAARMSASVTGLRQRAPPRPPRSRPP